MSSDPSEALLCLLKCVREPSGGLGGLATPAGYAARLRSRVAQRVFNAIGAEQRHMQRRGYLTV